MSLIKIGGVLKFPKATVPDNKLHDLTKLEIISEFIVLHKNI